MVLLWPQLGTFARPIYRQDHDRLRYPFGVTEPVVLQQLAHRVRLVAHRELGEIAVAGDLLIGDLEVLDVAFDLGRPDCRQPAVGLGWRQAAQQAAQAFDLALHQRLLARGDGVGSRRVDRDPAHLEQVRRSLRAGRRHRPPCEHASEREGDQHSRVSHCNATHIA
jgi:hypothetical protein